MDNDPRDRLAYDDSEDEADDEDRYGPPQPPAPPIRKLPVTPEIPRALPATPPVEPTRQAEPAVVPLTAAHNDSSGGSDESRPITTSKTAALIEMYRERERSTPPKPAGPALIPPVAPLQPSRLPVRSVGKEGGSLPTPQERANVTSSPVPPLPIEITLADPTRIVLEESGRASPARYVHGAPLHNVVEEEEEG